MQLDIHNNDPNIKIVVNEEFKEDDAVICFGMFCGKFEKPTWKSIRFTTKDLKSSTFENELVVIVSAMLIQSANYHGWTTWD